MYRFIQRGIGEKMKKTFLFILFFSLCACGQTLRIVWEPSDNADTQGLTYYTIYKWEGDSVAWQNWQPSDMDSIGTLPHVLNFAGPYEFTTYFQEDLIIRASGEANDSLGRKSGMKYSRFYFHPENLKAVRLEK